MTLKQLRIHLNLSNNAFAESIDLPPSRVSEYANGKRIMSVNVAHKIMTVHNVVASVDLDTKHWIFTPK